MHAESVNELITLCKCAVVAAITEALRGCQHKSQVIIQRLLCSVLLISETTQLQAALRP